MRGFGSGISIQVARDIHYAIKLFTNKQMSFYLELIYKKCISITEFQKAKPNVWKIFKQIFTFALFIMTAAIFHQYAFILQFGLINELAKLSWLFVNIHSKMQVILIEVNSNI